MNTGIATQAIENTQTIETVRAIEVFPPVTSGFLQLNFIVWSSYRHTYSGASLQVDVISDVKIRF